MIKTKTARKNTIILLLAIIPVAGVFAHYTAPGFAQSVQQLQQQIDSIKQEISGSEARIQQLREREDTLQNRLKILEAEIAQAEEELAKTEQEISATKQEIRETEQKIERLKKQMQENAKIIYKNGDPSTVEILFSSDNFTDFINRQEYLERAKKRLNEASDEAKKLQASLKDEKKELETLKTKQEGQRREIASRINEQENLLAQTRGEEARYQNLVAEQRQELERKREQQRQAYQNYLSSNNVELVAGDPNKGGYPTKWANPPLNSRVDDWGMYNRQCTSYAAWRVYNDGKHMPNWGRTDPADAKYWYDLARRDGIPAAHGQPQTGAIAVWREGDGMGDTYGHVAYVESVNSDGSIWVSQYNVSPGQYSEMRVGSHEASRLDYIYFQ